MAQLALSLVLLVSSGLLFGSVRELLSADRGFDGRDLLMARVDVEQAGYDRDRGRRLFRALRQRAASIPGVRSAGVALLVPPVLFDANVQVLLPGEPDEPRAARFNTVDREYFGTLGLELLEGRLFSLQDGDRARGVAVVNGQLAEALWPGESAIGRVLKLARPRSGDPSAEYDVIGVVASVAWYAASREPEPVLYTSWEQRFRPALWVLLRTDGAAAAPVLAALRAELHDLDPSLALSLDATHEQHRRQALVVQRLQSATVTLFCAVGVFLALLGVFSVTSQTVDEQVHQIGIRTAIGARRSDIQIWILRRAAGLAVLGSALGLAVSFWTVGLLERSVEGVRAVGPNAMLGAVAVLLGAALLAAWLPARRAARLDPLRALRRE